MSNYQPPSPYPTYGDTSTTSTSETSGPVNEKLGQAAEAASQGKEAAGQVAQTAVEHAQEVKQETVRQARDLVGEARQQLSEQAGTQHRNLVGNLRSLSSELGSMADNSDSSGIAGSLVSQARGRVDGAANWLDGREPGDLLDEVRTFARRRPGMFLLGALAAGVVAGRLTRGVVAAHQDSSSGTGAATGEYPAPYPAGDGGYAPVGGYPPGSGAPGGTNGEAGLPGYSTGPTQGYGSTSTYGENGEVGYDPTQAYPAPGGVRP